MHDIERLMIIESIRELKARYCRLADHKEWDQLAGLFTEDASLRFHDASGQIRSQIDGRGEIARKIGTSVGAAQPIHHIFSAEFVISSATEAQAVWAMEDRLIQPEGVKAPFRTMHGFGHYHEDYRLIGGRWLISKLEQTRLKLDFN
jgi:SnoaL-like domain